MARMRPGFIGEDRPDFFDSETGKWHNQVHYMDESERLEYRLAVGSDGRFYDAGGQRALDHGDRIETVLGFDTGTSTWTKDGRGRAIYVMDGHGDMYAAVADSPETKNLRHSSFLSGGPVAGAGEIEVVNGDLMFISRSSGHYRMSPEYLLQVVDRLRAKRLALKPEHIDWWGV